MRDATLWTQCNHFVTNYLSPVIGEGRLIFTISFCLIKIEIKSFSLRILHKRQSQCFTQSSHCAGVNASSDCQRCSTTCCWRKQNIRHRHFDIELVFSDDLDFAEMASNFAKLFHLVALGQFSYALYFNYKEISPKENKIRGFEFGGPLVYMTILTSVREIYFRLPKVSYQRVLSIF